ncbi:MAG: hypothetical protein EA415_05600 [Sphaerobacteraceae bacterium]|nr:MAG: hypothetical protein EA415_05600 [Sphaerobacteraceae bacterium]
MKTNWRSVRLAMVLTLLAAFVGLPAGSAQEPNRRITDTTGSMGGTANVVPDQLGYTATDDLWTWRVQKKRTSVQSQPINSVMTVMETRQPASDTFWKPGDELQMQHQMRVDLRYVPDMDSDSSGMISRTQLVEVSGRADGRLGWFIPDVGDEVIVGALNWDAKVVGSGTCIGDDCTIIFEMTGSLRDHKRKCGEMTVVAESTVNSADQVWGFKSISGMDSEADDLAFMRASLALDVAADGSTCYIGETEKNHLTGEVSFFYSQTALGGPDTTTRVMPGDNVQIDFYNRHEIEVNLVSSEEGRSDTLWDPATNPLAMLQDMQVEVRYDSERNLAGMSGKVRGVFPSGLVAEGQVSGRGKCDINGDGGVICEIQMIRTFDILEERSGKRCGSMSLSVTVDYVPEGSWTFRDDGRGVISLRENPNCTLIGAGQAAQPDTR